MGSGAEFVLGLRLDTGDFSTELQNLVRQARAAQEQLVQGAASSPTFGSLGTTPAQATEAFQKQASAATAPITQGLAGLRNDPNASPAQVAQIESAITRLQTGLASSINEFVTKFNVARETERVLNRGDTQERKVTDPNYIAAQQLELQAKQHERDLQTAAEANVLQDRRATIRGGPGTPGYTDVQEGLQNEATVALSRQYERSLVSLIKHQEYLSGAWDDLQVLVAEEVATYRKVVATDRLHVNTILLGDEEYKNLEAAQQASYQELNTAIKARTAALLNNPQQIATEAAGQVQTEKQTAGVAAARSAALAGDTQYTGDLGASRANEQRIETQRNSIATEALAQDKEYIGIKARGIVAQEQLDQNVKIQALAARTAADADREAALAVQEKKVATERQLAVSRQLLESDEASKNAAAQLALNQRLYATQIRQRTAQLAEEQGVYSGGTATQRVSAAIRQRSSGFPVDPESQPTAGQLVGNTALTTARFAVTGAALYGGFNILQQQIQSAKDFEVQLAPLDAELKAIGKGDQFGGLKSALLDISAETGASSADLAKITQRFVGVFQDGHAAADAARDVAKIAAVSGADLESVAQSTEAASKNFGITAKQLGDIGVQIRNAFGTPIQETLQFFGQISPVTSAYGFTAQQAATVAGGLTSQAPSKTGASEAESLNRILPDIYAHQNQLLNFQNQIVQGGGQQLFDPKQLQEGNLSGVLQDLLKNYDNLNAAQQKVLITDVTSSRNQQNLIALLDERSHITKVLSGEIQLQGSLDSEFAARQQTLKQQLAEVGAEFRKLGQGLYDNGISTILGDLGQVFGVLAQGGNAVVAVLEKLGPLQPLAIAIGGIVAAGKLAGPLGRIGGEVAGSSGFTGAVFRGAGVQTAAEKAAQKAPSEEADAKVTAEKEREAAIVAERNAQETATNALVTEQAAATASVNLSLDELRASYQKNVVAANASTLAPVAGVAATGAAQNSQRLDALNARRAELYAELDSLTSQQVALTGEQLAAGEIYLHELEAVDTNIAALAAATERQAAVQAVAPVVTAVATTAPAANAALEEQIAAVERERLALETQWNEFIATATGTQAQIAASTVEYETQLNALNEKLVLLQSLKGRELSLAEQAIIAQSGSLGATTKLAELDTELVVLKERRAELETKNLDLTATETEELTALNLAIAGLTEKIAAQAALQGGEVAATEAGAVGAGAGLAGKAAKTGGIVGGAAALLPSGPVGWTILAGIAAQQTSQYIPTSPKADKNAVDAQVAALSADQLQTNLQQQAQKNYGTSDLSRLDPKQFGQGYGLIDAVHDSFTLGGPVKAQANLEDNFKNGPKHTSKSDQVFGEQLKQYQQKVVDAEHAAISDLIDSGKYDEKDIDDLNKALKEKNFDKLQALQEKLSGKYAALATDVKQRRGGKTPGSLQDSQNQAAQDVVDIIEQNVTDTFGAFQQGDIKLPQLTARINDQIKTLSVGAFAGTAANIAEIKKLQKQLRDATIQAIDTEVQDLGAALSSGDISLGDYEGKINDDIAKLKTEGPGGVAKAAALKKASNQVISQTVQKSIDAQAQIIALTGGKGDSSEQEIENLYLQASKDTRLSGQDRYADAVKALQAEQQKFNNYVSGLKSNSDKLEALKKGWAIPSEISEGLLSQALLDSVSTYRDGINSIAKGLGVTAQVVADSIAKAAVAEGKDVKDTVAAFLESKIVAEEAQLIAYREAVANLAKLGNSGKGGDKSPINFKPLLDAAKSIGSQILSDFNALSEVQGSQDLTPNTKINASAQQTDAVAKAAVDERKADAKAKREAEAAYFKVRDQFDPAAQARDDKALAVQHFQDSQLETTQAKRDAAALTAVSEGIKADRSFEEAMFSVFEARVKLIEAVAGASGNQTAVVQGEVAIAKEKIASLLREGANGNSPALINAQAELVTKERELADQFLAVFDAQKTLAETVASAAGNQVEAARQGLSIAQDKVNELKGLGYLSNNPELQAANGAVVQKQRALYDANLKDKEDTIAFNLATKQISSSQAIAQYQVLLDNANTLHLTTQERRDLIQKIFDLKQSLQQNLQFNLPSDLALPTLYEARRFDQSGGNYQDSRVINISLTANSKFDGEAAVGTIVQAVNAAPRFGVRPRGY